MNAPPRSLAQRLVRNTFHAATGRMAGVVLWIAFTPPILRALGPEGFAVWALFFAVTGYLSALDLGLVQGTLRHVSAARHRGADDDVAAYATLGVLGYLLLGLVWLALALLLRSALIAWLRIPPALAGDASFAMLMGAGVFALAGCANVGVALLQGCDRFDLANRVNLAVSAVQAIGLVLALRQGARLQALVSSVIVAWAVGALVATVLLARAVPRFRWAAPRAAWRHWREVAAFGGPMQLAGAMSVVHTHLDKFLLSAWVALQAVTPYELGSRVLVSVLTLPQILLLAMLPAASVMHAAGDTARLHRLYDRGTHYLHAASAITIAVLIGSADRLYATWTGPGHDTAALVLRALAVASAFAMATGMASITARAIGRTDLEAGYGVSTVVLHLALSIVAVPAWGLVGALLASGVATVVTSVVFVARVARQVNLSRDEVLVRPNAVPALALVVGALAAWGLDRLLPAASGPAGWLLLVTVSAVAASAATAILVLSGFLRWREALALIGGAATGNGTAA